MLTKVAIKNFKSLRDVQIDLERFTVFVGPNGSGKSSFLQAMHTLCTAFHRPSDKIAESGFDARTVGTSGAVELAAELDHVWYAYRTRSLTTRATVDVTDAYHPWWEAKSDPSGEYPTSLDWRMWSTEDSYDVPLPICTLLQLDTAKLANPAAPPSGFFESMAVDGSGLHAATADMALSRPDTWLWIQESLRAVVPSVKKLRHTPLRGGSAVSLLFDTVGAAGLNATQVSEGTLLVLGLLVAMNLPYRPSLILLDDLDRGLHPKAQRELVGLLRGVLDSNHDLQIVATTHSPYLLGRMEPHEVRMTHLNAAGETGCDSLTHHPKFPKWKDEMSAGEMWSLFGEKWVVGQEVPA